MASSIGSLDVQARHQFLRFAQFLTTNPIAWKTAVALTSGGLLLKLNSVLNSLALNHYSTARQWDWSKEIVLITGGGGGVGELVARKLAKRGVKVVVFDIAAPKEPFPSNVWFYEVDVTQPESVASAAETLRKVVGEPTVLVNNAGISPPGDCITKPLDKMRKVFEVNTFAHFILAQEFVPNMIKNDHGHIIAVASLASFATMPGNCDYSCSKAAVMGFNEGLRQDLVHIHKVKNVCTSIIHPFFIRTPMTQAFSDRISNILEPEYVAEKIVKQILGGKSGRVILPSSQWIGTMLRGFPDWMQEAVKGSYSWFPSYHK